jgi:hypothetical protein
MNARPASVFTSVAPVLVSTESATSSNNVGCQWEGIFQTIRTAGITQAVGKPTIPPLRSTHLVIQNSKTKNERTGVHSPD